MTRAEILEEFKTLSMDERFAVIGAALQLIREDTRREDLPLEQRKQYAQLAATAAALYEEYQRQEGRTAST